MIVTLTTSLPFGYTHASLEMQAEACTPTKTLNGTQTAITSGTGTFEQRWGLDVGWSFLTVASLTAVAKILSDQDREPKGMNPGLNSDKNVQATTNKANEITGITNSIGAAWATPTNDPARI